MPLTDFPYGILPQWHLISKPKHMAELNNNGGSKVHAGHKPVRGVGKSKKLSTRIDLTPMVDLGFLLITFFIFTTALTKPTGLKLILPKDTKDANRRLVKNSAVITLLLAKNDQIYYYEGDSPLNGKMTYFKDVRNVLLDKKRRTDPRFFQVILKPSQDANYRNVVNILDEMTIDAIPPLHYALMDITAGEYRLIR